MPLQRKFFDFLSGNGAFWRILGAYFNVSIRRVKQSRKAVLCVSTANWSVISHGGRIIHDIIHINTYIRVIIVYMHECRKQANQLYNRRTSMENYS